MKVTYDKDHNPLFELEEKDIRMLRSSEIYLRLILGKDYDAVMSEVDKRDKQLKI